MRRHISISFAVFLGLLALFFLEHTISERLSPTARWRSVVDKAFNLISSKYVEKLPPEKLATITLQGMLENLDPYSQFFPPPSYREFDQAMHGNYGGIGIFIEKHNLGIKIATPIIGGPAFKAGLRPGDIITAIDDISATSLSLMEARDLMRGTLGTEVKIHVFRPKPRRSFEVSLRREKIHIPSVMSARLLKLPQDLKVGYVILSDFRDETQEELEKALRDLLSQGMQYLVLDLRGNGGGALSGALSVSDLFLSKGVIVRIRYRGGEETVEKAHTGTIGSFPIAVLVNGGTASASEIVSAALRDNERAVLIGEPTYGKGSVQQVFDLSLPDGSVAAVKITVAYFFSPNGYPISKRLRDTDEGMPPDIIVEMDEDAMKAYSKAVENEWILTNTGESHSPLVEEVDPQLQKAVEALTGVPLFDTVSPAPDAERPAEVSR